MKPSLQAVPQQEQQPTVRPLKGPVTDRSPIVGPPWARPQEKMPAPAEPLLDDLLKKVGKTDREQDFAANTAALVKK